MYVCRLQRFFFAFNLSSLSKDITLPAKVEKNINDDFMKLGYKISASTNLFPSIYLILSSFVMLWPAFFNGYPLFYSDSAVYILASNLFGKLSKSEDLPYLSGMGYAWFIRLVTWRSTLYLVIYAQALILNILIYQSLKVLLSESKIYKFHLPIIIILSFCSSMGWTTSQLMPDIFTSYLVLSVFLFYSWNNKSRGIYVFLSIIIMLSILSHLTNITISVLILGFLIIVILLMKLGKKELVIFIKKSVFFLALIFISLMILVGLNKKYYHYAGLSPTSNIFFIARLMDTGFMRDFLYEKCPEKSYEMCNYKDNLPRSYEDFLWSPESVFNKTGGWNINAHKEYGLIIHDVLTTPKYLGKFLYNCGVHSLHQLTAFEIGDGLTSVYNTESSQYQTVIKHFDKREFREDFIHSKQTQGKLKFGVFNLMNYILLAVSTVIIFLVFIIRKFDRNMVIFTFIIISGVVINAAATSSLSSVFNRFQSRIIWLIPLLACIYFSKFIYPMIKSKAHKLSK